jgi:hypothetical protein
MLCMNKIYRVPTKKGYVKTRIDKGKAWKDLYGKKKCVNCKKYFAELELYTFVGNDPYHFQHVDCKHPKEIID